MSPATFEAIKQSGRLPSPTGIALEILRLAEDPTSTVQQLAATLEKDPALSARILRIANSPLTGLCRRVACVQQATTLLGRHEVSRLSLCFCLISRHRTGECPGFNYGWFWSDSLGRATAARIFARYLRSPHTGEAFSAALLSQVGRLAFATIYPSRYARLLAAAASDGIDALAALEIAEFGMDHCALAGAMLNEWRLPALLCEAVSRQRQIDAEDPPWPEGARTLVHTLELSGSVASVLTGAAPTNDVWAKCVMQANRLGVAPDAFREQFDLVREQWRVAGAVLSVGTRDVPSADELEERAARLTPRADGEMPALRVDHTAEVASA